MIKALENLGNAISSDSDFTDEDELSQHNVAQWVGVVNAVAHNTDIQKAVDAVEVGAFGSDIVKLIGSLRNEDVVKYMSQKIDWSKLLHNNWAPTTQRSAYHENSFRNRVLANLTERSFWIRQFGSDQAHDDTFDNIAFVFHAAFKQGYISFEHPIASALFKNPVPLGTAVLAHQLGERYYIFENTPFDNIALEHQPDFFVAGCLHMGAREDHLDPEEHTLGEGRLNQLIDTLGTIDVNAMYAPSDYLCQALGWNNGTQCPLGVVGLALLAATPIHAPSTVAFAQQILQTLKLEACNLSLLTDALLHTTSWDTSMVQSPFGHINSLVVSHIMWHDPTIVRGFVLDQLEKFENRSADQQNTFRHFLIQASRTPNVIFSLDDAPALLTGFMRVFDVTIRDHGWSPQKLWGDWWHGSFKDSLSWFDNDSAQKVEAFMKPYLIAMVGIAVSARDDEQRAQCKLTLEIFDANRVFTDHTPRKLKM